MMRELVDTYLSAIAADHVHMMDHRYSYDVVRDLGAAAVAHLNGEVPERDSAGYLSVDASSLCMDGPMWETVVEAAEAIRHQHAELQDWPTQGCQELTTEHVRGLDHDRLAAVALLIRRAAYGWLIAQDLAEDDLSGQRLIEIAGAAADVAVGVAPRGQQSTEIIHQADQVDCLFTEFFDLVERVAHAGIRNSKRSRAPS